MTPHRPAQDGSRSRRGRATKNSRGWGYCPRLRYEDDRAEYLHAGDRTVVKDKKASRYFEVATASLPSDIRWRSVRSRLTPKWYRAYVGVAAALLTVHLSLVFVPLPAEDRSQISFEIVALAAVYTVVQAGLHEAGHVIALRFFGRKPDKISLKLNFKVLPAIYVRMNDAHMLEAREKILVHSAGLAVNGALGVAVLCTNHLWFQSEGLRTIIWIFAVGLWANTLPLLTSDGHKILLAALDVNERRDMALNRPFVRRIHRLSWCTAIALAFLMIRQVAGLWV